MHISTQGRPWESESWAPESDGNIESSGATSSVIALPVEGIAGLGGAFKVRMDKGLEFETHQHGDWVVVTVLSGKVQVAHEGDAESCVFEAGDTYLVEPGSVHRETMLVNSEVIVVHGPGVVGERFSTRTVNVETKGAD